MAGSSAVRWLSKAVKAIFSRDYMVVQGVVMVFALATVAVSLLADILTVALDPRIKL